MVILSASVDGNHDAATEADRITKILPHPDDLKGLGAVTAQKTVKHLSKISGKNIDTMSKSGKTKLKHDTTVIDDRDKDTQEE